MGTKLNHTTACLLALALPAEVRAVDQTSAQEDARLTHDDGSDRSVKKAYTNALNAVDNFYNLNIPGAIHYGVKAYGNYRNHEKMDDLRDKNARLEGSMSSANSQALFASQPNGNPGENPASTVTGPTGPKKSPYEGMDPKFLHDDPETAAVAARVEQITGLSRDKLLQLAAKVHTENIDRGPNDADFVTRAKQVYRQMVDAMPSHEFRENIRKAENIAAMRPVQEILAKLRGVDEPAVAQGEAPPAAPAPAQEAEKPQDAVASASAVEPAREPASAATPNADGSPGDGRFSERGTVTPTRDPNLLGLDRLGQDNVDPFLTELAKTGTAEEDQRTIFQVMSGKLREMNIRLDLQHRHEPAGAPAPVAASN